MSWNKKNNESNILSFPVKKARSIKKTYPASHLAPITDINEYREKKETKKQAVFFTPIKQQLTVAASAAIMSALMISFFLQSPTNNRGLASHKKTRVIAEGGNVDKGKREILKTKSLTKRFFKYLKIKQEASKYKGF